MWNSDQIWVYFFFWPLKPFFFFLVYVGGWQDVSLYQIPEVSTTLKCVCVSSKSPSSKRLALLAWRPYPWGPASSSNSNLPYLRATERKQSLKTCILGWWELHLTMAVVKNNDRREQPVFYGKWTWSFKSRNLFIGRTVGRLGRRGMSRIAIISFILGVMSWEFTYGDVTGIDVVGARVIVYVGQLHPWGIICKEIDRKMCCYPGWYSHVGNVLLDCLTAAPHSSPQRSVPISV